MGTEIHMTLDLYQFQNDQDADSRHFGVCVSSLTSDKNSVPVVLEKLLEYVEMHGLYTEGIYRKSGSANRMRELKQLLQTGMLRSCCQPFLLPSTEFSCPAFLRTSVRFDFLSEKLLCTNLCSVEPVLPIHLLICLCS